MVSPRCSICSRVTTLQIVVFLLKIILVFDELDEFALKLPLPQFFHPEHLL
jgi:hypothetical protein